MISDPQLDALAQEAHRATTPNWDWSRAGSVRVAYCKAAARTIRSSHRLGLSLDEAVLRLCTWWRLDNHNKDVPEYVIKDFRRMAARVYAYLNEKP